jgi:hypothetical protein
LTFSQLPGPSRGTEAFDKFFGVGLSQAGLTRPAAPSDGILFDAPGYPGGIASGLKVYALANDQFACGNLRIRYPLMNLAARGARVKVAILSDETPVHIEDLQWANVIMVQRWGTPEMADAIMNISRATGAAVVYEIDDFLHGVHPKSPAFEMYNGKTPAGALMLRTLTYWMHESVGTIFSTRELASVYEPNTKNGHVILNGLDLKTGERDWNGDRLDWRGHAHGCHVTAKSLLFGLSCSDTHEPDLPEMGGAIREVLERTKDTFFGFQTNPELAYRYTRQMGLPLDRVVYLPPTPFKDYPRQLSMFDVALCPLENTTFNHCKSNLRLLEFGAWGVPYVASKVGPFQRFHQETKGQGGLIADNPDQWAGHILKLLKSEHYRRLKGDFLKHHVHTEHDIQNTAEDLAYSLRSFILARHGRFRAPSLQSVRDAVAGVPSNPIPLNQKGLCPCGSGRTYRQCCTPAWG